MDMTHINADLNVVNAVPMGIMIDVLKKLPDLGINTTDEMMDLGHFLVVDRSVKPVIALSSNPDQLQFVIGEYLCLAVDRSNSRCLLTTDKGDIYLQSNNVGEFSHNKEGFTPALENDVSEQAEGLVEWLAYGERGASSEFMSYTLFGQPGGDDDHCFQDHPHDPSDFRRCLGFLHTVPSARENLELLRDTTPEWKALIAVWDELELLFDQEKDQKSAPLLYQKIQSAIDSARDKSVSKFSPA